MAKNNLIEMTQFKMKHLERGKELLSIEQWVGFAYCRKCNHQNCKECKRRAMNLADALKFLPEDYEIDSGGVPPKLWNKVIRCCSCGSENHIIYWLDEALWPELYVYPEVEKALLHASKRARRTKS